MSHKNHALLLFCFFIFFAYSARAVTLNSSQTDYTTTSNITTSGPGISSTFSGSISTLNKIKNLHIVTTGNSGATASAYGIKSGGNYNQITNAFGATISTTGNSGRGISAINNSIIINDGNISTQGTTSYGIYVGSDNIINNSGSINTTNATSYGIYLDGDNNFVTNSGSINTTVNGIKTSGDNSTITNLGNITSATYAIYNSNSGTIINNLGTLSGGVALNGATLNIWGGDIIGNVDGLSGGGNVNLGSVANPSVIYNQTINFNDLNTFTITSASTLNSSAILDFDHILIDQNSTLNLYNHSATSALIKGVSNGFGTLNISKTNFSTTNSLGISGNALANLNIASDASLNGSSNIYVNNILLAGSLNFSASNGKTIFGSLSTGGLATINIGERNQIINGNFSLNSGSQLAVTLKSGGSGSLDIAGATNINANAKLAITTNAGYIANGQYSLINSASGSTINQISAENISINNVNSNIYNLLEFTTIATSSQLLLNINRLAATKITADKNAQKIYQNLNEVGSNSHGTLLGFQQYLNNTNLNSYNITDTLKQLGPQSSKAKLLATNNIVNNAITMVENRLEKISNRNANEYSPNNFWLQAFGGASLQKAIKDDDGYKANMTGFVIGLDQEISDSATFGAAISTTKSKVENLDNAKENSISTYQVNVYGNQNFDNFILDGIASLALNGFDSTRNITASNAIANAKYHGQTYGFKIKGGWMNHLDNGLVITPEISLNFLRNNISGYSEIGASELNLDVEKISANFLESRVGLNVAYFTVNFDFYDLQKLSSNLRISYGHALINDAPTTKARFSGQTIVFDSQISYLDANSMKLGLEMAAYNKDDTVFSINYNVEHRTTFDSYMLSAKIRREF
jgi:uncharacterized protein with beta-barrel porin domain